MPFIPTADTPDLLGLFWSPLAHTVTFADLATPTTEPVPSPPTHRRP